MSLTKAVTANLRDQIIAAITAHPNIRKNALAIQFPDASLHDITVLLRDLVREGSLEKDEYHRYRKVQEPKTAVPSPRHASSGFIAPVPKARLMGGR